MTAILDRPETRTLPPRPGSTPAPGGLERLSTDPPAPRRTTLDARVAGGRVRGEWIKLRSLRSTWWALAGGLAAMLATGVGFALAADPTAPIDPNGDPSTLTALGPVGLTLAGYQLARLVIAALGVLLVTSEYASGSIKTTFAAVPSRWPVLAAKAAVLIGLLIPAALAATVVTFLSGQAALGEAGVSLTDPGVPRALAGTALYLTAVGLLGSGLGWLIRHTAGAVTAVLGLVFVVPVVGSLLPGGFPDLLRWLPTNAGEKVMQLHTADGALGPWTGFAGLCGWVAAAFLAAVISVRRRDV